MKSLVARDASRQCQMLSAIGVRWNWSQLCMQSKLLPYIDPVGDQ
jgi:hypothetical protein